jgi:DNA polymerase-1
MATLKDAYKLIHEGALALSRIESAGMRIDEDYLNRTLEDVKRQIRLLESELKGYEEFEIQNKMFGTRTKITSRQQLATVLFEKLGHKSKSKTSTGRKQLDETALEAIGTPYTTKFLKLEKLRKLESTYLQGVLKETVDGYLRPFFNLHLATTFRSSSGSPNFQNIPTRDPEIAERIRRAFIPRDGYVLVEIDYSALEFRVAASFWRDQEMISYASDPKKDIHRDCAAEIFMCEREDVSKQARYAGKNMFVFPQIYGDYYINCARSCWEAMENLDLRIDEVPMRRWMEVRGITELGACNSKYPPIPGTFEWHMKKVQDTFNRWFPKFSKSKEVWWQEYKSKGYFDLMTGFRIQGVYKKNFVFNCPIQGPAFHLLLWSLTQLVRWIEKEKMKTKIVGQIHDSIVADVHKSELRDYVQKARQVMTEDVRKHWDWVVTPLDVEVEIAEENWFEKRSYNSDEDY